jgi:hypothetical protein
MSGRGTLVALGLTALACAGVMLIPAGVTVQNGRRILRSASGCQTVSMLNGGRTGLYYDVGEEAGRLRPGARRVVLLGMGGGEMLRAARRSLPEAELVGVELDAKVAALAISDFGVLDLGVRVVIKDAFEYVAGADNVDLLFVDVFDDSTLPARFRSTVFFRACLDSMTRDGLFVMNVWPAELAPGVMLHLYEAGFHGIKRRNLMEGNVLVFAEP